MDLVGSLQSCPTLSRVELEAGAAVPSLLFLWGFPAPRGSSLPSCHSPGQIFHAQLGQNWGGGLAGWNIQPGMNNWRFWTHNVPMQGLFGAGSERADLGVEILANASFP